MLKGLDHVNINTPRLKETRSFYVEALGLEVIPRPDMPGVEMPPGCWLGQNGRDFVHLMTMNPKEGAGPVDHFALVIDDFEATRARLEQRNVPFREWSERDGSFKQIFVQDPNGVMVELNWRAVRT